MNERFGEPRIFQSPDKGGDFGEASEMPKKIEQLESFQEVTARGLHRLQELIKNKEEFDKAQWGFRKAVFPEQPEFKGSEVYFLTATLFDKGPEFLEEKKNLDFLAGKNVTVLEYAGSEDGEDFDNMSPFLWTGANYVGTDIAVEEEKKYPSKGKQGSVEILNVDVTKPEEKLTGRSFGVVYSNNFYGYPINWLAKGNSKRMLQLEKETIEKFDKFIKPGGFHIIASTLEHPNIEKQEIREMGYDIVEIPQKYMGATYWVLRKQGSTEKEQ